MFVEGARYQALSTASSATKRHSDATESWRFSKKWLPFETVLF